MLGNILGSGEVDGRPSSAMSNGLLTSTPLVWLDADEFIPRNVLRDGWVAPVSNKF